MIPWRKFRRAGARGLALFGWWPALFSAELKMPAVFSDHAVLQAGAVVPVWGAADPDERLVIELAGQRREVSANASGEWTAQLAPLAADGKLLVLTVTGARPGRRIECRDLLAGEVWLAAGQSNMAMTVSVAGENPSPADEPWVENVRAYYDGKWHVLAAAPDVQKVSAVGWAFARQLARTRRQPVGLVVAARGGTRIEAWMSRDALNRTTAGRAMVELSDRPEVQAAAASDARTPRSYDQTELYRWRLGRALPTSLHASLIAPLGRFALRGVVWYQGESNASRMEDAAAYADHLEQLVIDWRRQFARADLPFLVVQLPRYDQPPTEGGVEPWTRLRDSQQAATARLRDALLIDTFDLGDPANIHPRRKVELGLRLAERAAKLPATPP